MITGIIDLATYYLRLSVLISWVAPRGSMVRRLLIPLPSLSVDPAMAMGGRLRVCSSPYDCPRRASRARRASRGTYTHSRPAGDFWLQHQRRADDDDLGPRLAENAREPRGRPADGGPARPDPEETRLMKQKYNLQIRRKRD